MLSTPPGERIPPEHHARQPFEPTNEVVAAAHVGQLVGQNPLGLLCVDPAQQRLRQDDANLPANPPHQRRELGRCRADGRDLLQPQPARDRRADLPQAGRRNLRSPPQQPVEPVDAHQRPDENEPAAEQPGKKNGGLGLLPYRGRRLFSRRSIERARVDLHRGAGQRPIDVGRCNHRGVVRRGRDGDNGDRHYGGCDQFYKDQHPEQVRDDGTLGGRLDEQRRNGQGERDTDIAHHDSKKEVRHDFPPFFSWPSRMARSCSMSLRDIFFCSMKCVMSGASEPPVSLAASDSS